MVWYLPTRKASTRLSNIALLPFCGNMRCCATRPRLKSWRNTTLAIWRPGDFQQRECWKHAQRTKISNAGYQQETAVIISLLKPTVAWQQSGGFTSGQDDRRYARYDQRQPGLWLLLVDRCQRTLQVTLLHGRKSLTAWR